MVEHGRWMIVLEVVVLMKPTHQLAAPTSIPHHHYNHHNHPPSPLPNNFHLSPTTITHYLLPIHPCHHIPPLLTTKCHRWVVVKVVGNGWWWVWVVVVTGGW